MLLIALFLFILGLIFGSFANVVIDRGQEEKSFLGSSECDHCGYKLKWHDNIPVLSFLFLKGKCRKCKKKISWQYPIIEIVSGLLFVFVGWRTGTLDGIYGFEKTMTLSFSLTVAFLFLLIFVWDLKYMIIPDGLVLGGVVVTIIYLVYQYYISSCSLFDPNCSLSSNLIGALIVGGFFYLLFIISSGKWVGGGDVKLGLWLGLLIGWKMSYFFLLLAYVLGAIAVLPLLLSKKKNLKSKIPFGPFLIISAFIIFFFGEVVLNWYRSIIF